MPSLIVDSVAVDDGLELLYTSFSEAVRLGRVRLDEDRSEAAIGCTWEDGTPQLLLPETEHCIKYRYAVSKKQDSAKKGSAYPHNKMLHATLGAWAAVRTTDGSTHHGVVYTLDPECGHLVLLQPTDGDSTAVLPRVLFSASIVSIAQASDASDGMVGPGPLALHCVEATGSESMSDAPKLLDAAAIEHRRTALCSLLRSQRAPFEELPRGELLILGCLKVMPPYTPSSCRCENEIVLDRFLDMLEKSAIGLHAVAPTDPLMTG